MVGHNSGRSHNAFLSPSAHVPVNFDLDTRAGGPQLAVVGLDTHARMRSAVHPSVKSNVGGIASTTHPPMKSFAVPMTSTAHPPMMSSALPMTSTAYPPMMSSAVPMTSTTHPPMMSSAVVMTSTAHPPLSVTSALLRPLSSAARIPLAPSAAGDSMPSSTIARPLASTDIKGDVQPPLPKVVNVESVLTYPVQNPRSCLHSDPVQPSSTAHVPSLTRSHEVQHSSHHKRYERNLSVSTATEVPARNMQLGMPVSGGLRPLSSYQTPVSPAAVSYPPHHSSSNDFKAPSGHSTTSYPLYTEAPPSFLRPVPASDTHACFLTSRLPTFCNHPQQSMPTSMGHIATCEETGAANSEAFAQQRPQESDPQSPSRGAREFIEHYRPESRTPPKDEWTSLPPATPQLQLLEDEGTPHTCMYATRDGESHQITPTKTPSPAKGRPRALHSDSSDDELAPENQGKTLQPHVVSHSNTGSQTATAEFNSAALSVSPLLSVYGYDTNAHLSDDKTKDRGVQTTETDHFDSRQRISESGKENSFLSHSSLKQATVQAVVSKNETRDGSQKAVTSTSSSADLKPVGHSKTLRARATDGHPRALSPILPSKVVPTPDLSSRVRAESSDVNEAHLEALMATALLNAQDTVNTIRSMARLNRSLLPSSTVLTSPSPGHRGDSRGDFPDVMALGSGLERCVGISPDPPGGCDITCKFFTTTSKKKSCTKACYMHNFHA